GSHKDRSEYFAKALGSGGSPAWMTQDEVRALEELNPMGGDAALLPLGSTAAPEPVDTSAQDAQNAKQEAQVERAIQDISEVKTLVNMSLLAPKQPVLPPNTEVKTGDTHIHLPENLVKIYNEAAKQEPSQVTVNLPEVQPPVINVAPAEVKVDIAAPNVSFEAVMPTPNIIVSLPTRKTDTTVTRDRDGNILTATQIEQDA
ncbi:MAG TPA: hypothetical protein PLE21_00210, partial [Giesbergeria sp.]|nr:hypothetical protein [Giesbergeria sp.]